MVSKPPNLSQELGVEGDLPTERKKDPPTRTKTGAEKRRENTWTGTETRLQAPEMKAEDMNKNIVKKGGEEEALHLAEKKRLDMRRDSEAPAMMKK